VVAWRADGKTREGIMQEVLARGWADFLGRLDGPMHFRFIVQPLVAMVLGVRAGVRDARVGEPPFLWAVVHLPERRRERVRQGLRDVAGVMVAAGVLDAAYQLIVHRGIYLLELLVTVVVLALVPYALVRGPAARLSAWKQRHARPGHGASRYS
jgi:hypothetical protein